MSHHRDQAPSPRATIRQSPKRSVYDRQTTYDIIDQAIIATVAISVDQIPFVLPMAIARIGNDVYLHGSRTSRLMKYMAAGNETSICVTHLDGLVVARSAMHCSANYRSVVIHGCGVEVNGPEKAELLHQITTAIIPGSDGDYRDHLPKELKATSLIAFSLDESASKVRQGGPIDDKDDLGLPYWAGVIPITQQYGKPISSDDLSGDIKTPDYAQNYQRPVK